MEIGQVFNPHKVFTGAFIPNAVMRYKGLSSNEKLVYGCLLQYAGKNGVAWPTQQDLADECGIGRRQCISALSELESEGFIKSNGSQGARKQYTFLWHTIFQQACANTAQVHAQTYASTAQEPSEDETCADIAHVDKVQAGTCADIAQVGDSEEGVTCADIAQEVVQKPHMSCANSAHPTMKRFMKRITEENQPSSSQYIPSDISENTRAPDEENETDEAKAVKLLSSLLAGIARDYHYQQLYDLWEDYSHELILDTLKDMQARGIRHSSVLPYLRKTVKDQAKKQRGGQAYATSGLSSRMR